MKIKYLLTLSIVLILLSGCYMFFPSYTEGFEEEYSAAGVEAMNVSNVTGSVTILPGTGKSIVVKAVKKSWLQSDLSWVTIDVTEGKILSVVSRYPAGRTSSVSVDYTIILPEGINVSVDSTTGDIYLDGVSFVSRVSTVTGNITLGDCGGLKNLVTTTGNISAEISETNNDISIRATTGNVGLKVSPDINASINTSVVTGRYTGPKTEPNGDYSIDVSVVTGDITVSNL